MSSKKLNEQGFSLLEVIVALAIMAVGFVTVLQLFSGSIRSVGMSEEYLKGIALANNKISELELADFVTEEFSGQFENEEDYSWELNIEPYDTPLNKEDANILVFQVNLAVSWSQSGKERNVELVTLRTLGDTYPAADSILSGSEKMSIIGGGVGNVSFGAGTEEEDSPEPDENATANLSGLETDVNIGDISGLRTTSQVNLSGAGIR